MFWAESLLVFQISDLQYVNANRKKNTIYTNFYQFTFDKSFNAC